MRAMVLEQPRTQLVAADVPVPTPAATEVLVKVSACGVCRTDLHVIDGDLQHPKLPLIPGHEIVGHVVEGGSEGQLRQGDRVGIPWLGHTCGSCGPCLRGDENLCERARFTGYDLDGGYAEYTCVDERYCFPIPGSVPDEEVAPWLCAGLIGYRSLCKAGDARRLGLYGFGAAAHLVAQIAKYEGREIFAFTRVGDSEGQRFALSLGAVWAGASSEVPPEPLDAAIIFAPVGSLVPAALAAVRPGGRVVCAGIHMTDIPSFRYELLWREREIVSVANLTRQDGEAFLTLAPKIPLKATVEPYPLADANRALDDLREGRVQGAAVLVTSDSGSH